MLGRILIVDDDAQMGDLLVADLEMRGYEACAVKSARQGLEQLESSEFNVLLTDVRMPGTSGIELCRQVNASWPHIPVIVMTAFGSMETAVEALRAGAFDFVTKPVEMDLLAAAIGRANNQSRLQEQVRQLSETVDRAAQFGEIIGDSPVMQAVYSQLARIAATESSILLTGESGTGKELVARCIHRRSRRSSGPFLAVNCAALPETLLESELFGHTKGAFTDARNTRIGIFEQANRGTILLDEIGEMPLAMQAKLLRALEERTVRPIGGNQEVPFDVRLLSATNHDLEAAIEAGTFREDLFYRINVIAIELPPLRTRGADILQLAQHFAELNASKLDRTITGIHPTTAGLLMAYNWPGNVRELRNVMERAVALTQSQQIQPQDLPEKIRDYKSTHVVIGGDNPSELETLEEMERRYIQHVLQSVGGNQTQAARVLGVDRKTLYRKLKAEKT